MNPFYFGTSEKQLFGIHHPPESSDYRSASVLVCPPFGPEHVPSHRPLQQLATLLARSGFHVLRFDYYGSGDSAGDLEDACVAQWLEDIRTAAQELLDTSGNRYLHVVGLRLGATLAALAAADVDGGGIPGLDAAVLWEPLARGADYLEHLRAQHREWIGSTFPRPRAAALATPGMEVVGFRISDALRAELEAADLLQLEDAPAERVLLLQNEPGDRHEALRGHLASLCDEVSLRQVDSDRCWQGPRGGQIALVPVASNRTIVEWLVEADA